MNLDSKILVTGGSGLVGSAIVRKLKENCYKNILTPTHAQLDFLNKNKLSTFLRSQKPDIVICAAAIVGGIGGNSRDNYGFLKNNLEINLNTISQSLEHGVKKLVFLGSSCIYPKFAKQPIVETELLNGQLEPTNEGYALAKITGIKLCEHIRKQNNVCFYSLMPCNLYGPGDNYNLESGHVLPTLIRKFVEAYENKSSYVVLWGDGSPLREFLYSDDLADAVVKSLQLNESTLPNLMNIGSGVEISIKNLANIIKNEVGYEGEIIWDTTKPNGTPRKIMDSTLFKNLTNWYPKTNLINGISNCINDFILNRGKLRK